MKHGVLEYSSDYEISSLSSNRHRNFGCYLDDAGSLHGVYQSRASISWNFYWLLRIYLVCVAFGQAKEKSRIF